MASVHTLTMLGEGLGQGGLWVGQSSRCSGEGASQSIRIVGIVAREGRTGLEPAAQHNTIPAGNKSSANNRAESIFRQDHRTHPGPVTPTVGRP